MKLDFHHKKGAMNISMQYAWSFHITEDHWITDGRRSGFFWISSIKSVISENLIIQPQLSNIKNKRLDLQQILTLKFPKAKATLSLSVSAQKDHIMYSGGRISRKSTCFVFIYDKISYFILVSYFSFSIKKLKLATFSWARHELLHL